MSRATLPFCASDISALARSLNSQLTHCDHTPGHVELLNMLARASGCRNFQHFRARLAARDQLDCPPPAPASVDYLQVQRLARHFDASGRLVQWPGKFSHREPCLWVLWSKLPARQVLTEYEINRELLANHLFADPALLRREALRPRAGNKDRGLPGVPASRAPTAPRGARSDSTLGCTALIFRTLGFRIR